MSNRNKVTLPIFKESENYIHQIWFNFSKKPSGERPNSRSRRLQQKCKDINKDWSYILWTEEMCLSLIERFYPWFLKTYLSYPYHIQRVDSARYFILFTYGGFYIDIDVECLQSFTKIRRDYPGDVYFVESPNCFMPALTGKGVSNSIIFCKKGDRFMEDVLSFLSDSAEREWYQSRHMYIMFSTGPSFINKVIKNSTEKVNLFPSKFFNPFGLCSVMDPDYKKNKSLYTVHHNFGSWEDGDSSLLKSIFCNSQAIVVIVVISILLIILLNRLRRD